MRIITRVFVGIRIRIERLRNSISPKNYFKGLFDDFETPKLLSKGYDSNDIFKRIIESNEKVLRGEGLYESNGIVVNQNTWSNSSIFLGLSLAFIDSEHRSILDFGGSMGTILNQYQEVLDKIPKLQWSIVEQSHYVEYAKQHFESDILKFYKSVDECFTERKPNIFLASGSIQYLPNPFELIDKVISLNFDYIIIGTLPLYRNKNGHKVTIQNIDTENYKASLPSWIFDRKLFLKLFNDKYTLINVIESPINLGIIGIRYDIIKATVILKKN